MCAQTSREMEEEYARPSRRAKRAPTKKPSASLYVGYVDDEETPEMIMKKFEMLDKLLAASSKGLLKEPRPAKPKKGKKKRDTDDYTNEKLVPAPTPAQLEPLAPDQPLNEHQLSLLFKMTSSFSVPTDGFLDTAFDGYYEPDDFDFSDEENFFLGEDEFFGSGEAEKKKRRKSEPKMRKRKERDLRGVGTYKPKMKLLSMELVGADGLYYTIKKKVKMVDPLLPTYVRIPSQVPLPRSWARTVTPYMGLNHEFMPEGCTYIEAPNVASFPLTSLNRKFQGVLMDPPWADLDSLDENGLPRNPHEITAAQLYDMRLDLVVDGGLLLIWTEKQHIGACIKVTARWGFTYVENLIWVKQNVDHTVSDTFHPFFDRSKISLLIFKKGTGFTLRHQRNPDVIFDYVRENKYGSLDKPKYAYVIAEILLPDACYNEETQQGQFLEVWARRGAHRKGWTSIVQQIPDSPVFLHRSSPSSMPLVV